MNSASQLSSFAPVIGQSPRVLILGSMPGVISLQQQQYYAHPRNAFWSIMGELFGANPELEYDVRLQILADEGVVLWDVLKHCEREGSLDSAICRSSEVTNEIPQLLHRYPQLRTICFNGGKAWSVFRAHLSSQVVDLEGLTLHQLPSTSPANARYSYACKLELWKQALSSQ